MVVQVSAAGDGALALIEKIRRHWNPLVVVAIANDASERGELTVRRAGATAYLGPSADVEVLESVLRQAVPGAIPDPLENVEVKVRKGEPGTKKSKNTNRRHGGAG
ncbi:MAG: response regulator [Phycisphaerales bacterium]|nr:response regulator [Phycisphaerales bacterium]